MVVTTGSLQNIMSHKGYIINSFHNNEYEVEMSHLDY